MSPKLNSPNVLAGPVVIEGDVARVIKEPNGSGRIDVWTKGAGWTEAAPGSITPDQFMPGACRPVSARDAARVGMPLFAAKDLRELGVKMAEVDALLMLKRKARQVAELDHWRPRLVIDNTTMRQA